MIPRFRPNFAKDSWSIFLKSLFFNNFIYGKEIQEFEKNFSKYLKVKYCIATPSARVGLYLILKSINIKKGDEIIIPAYNTPIIPKIITLIGAKPIPVDVEYTTLNINTNIIEKKINENTRAIIALHVEGQPCKIEKILEIAKKHNLYVIEDCAHALGSEYKGKKVGSLGDAAIFSFGIGKMINTLGGGIITTNNKEIQKRIREMINSFKNPSKFSIIKKFLFYNFISIFTKPTFFTIFVYPVLLFNFHDEDIITYIFKDEEVKINDKNLIKFSNFQALLGIQQLKTLNKILLRKQTNISILLKNLNKKIKHQVPLPNSKSIYLNFTVLTQDRKRLRKILLKRGIDTQVSWMKSCAKRNECRISDKIAKEALYVPTYPSLSKEEMLYIANTLNKEFR
jgi:dTDP-4-amino-4,6-dideoxygalactose transaminase